MTVTEVAAYLGVSKWSVYKLVDRRKMQMSAHEPGRPEAAKAIWNWRDKSAKESAGMAPGRGRIVGSVQALVAAGFGLAIYVFLPPARPRPDRAGRPMPDRAIPRHANPSRRSRAAAATW